MTDIAINLSNDIYKCLIAWKYQTPRSTYNVSNIDMKGLGIESLRNALKKFGNETVFSLGMWALLSVRVVMALSSSDDVDSVNDVCDTGLTMSMT